MYIPKIATVELSDIDRFIIGLRELCLECNVSGISGLQLFFSDGTYGGYKAIFEKTNLFTRDEPN